MSEQRDLYFGDEDTLSARKLARSEHPQTSKDAARAVLDQLPRLYAYVLGAVTINRGLTASELSQQYDERDTRRIGRRLPELERKGLIRRGDTPALQGDSPHGRSTWWPVDGAE